MKIYTRTGDTGQTGLIGGRRVPKNSETIQAIGDVDELNAALGLAAAAFTNSIEIPLLSRIQDDLFQVGSELAAPGDERFHLLTEAAVKRLEASIDEMDVDLPALKNFILPGGSELAARLHFSRSVCRRAERSVLNLSCGEPIRPIVQIFLNRLSDWLFVAARTANARQNVQDVVWKKGS